MSDSDWQKGVADALGGSLGHWQQLGGGDFASAWRAELTRVNTPPEPIFIKTHGAPPPNHFSTEARGLAWLADARAVSVAGVKASSDVPPFLALEWIEQGGGRGDNEAEFGRQLAALHRSGAPCFGREDQRSTGSLGLPNKPCDNWATFYAENRLLPLAAIAGERASVPTAVLADIETLAMKLAQLAPNDEPPQRLHGDLWAGNRLVDVHGTSWLIDPAAHGGHREFDLAMMRLFGGFGEAAFAAYHESYPLADGWPSRIALHQLAPLIVHAIKFGGHYVAEVQSVVQRYS